MYELTVKTRKQLERATLRAQAEKPKIQEVHLGLYKVWSATSDALYLVNIEPASDGEGYDVCCTCPTQRTFCKHLAAVMPNYMMRLNEQEQSEPEAAPVAAPAHVPAAEKCLLCPALVDEGLDGFCTKCWNEKEPTFTAQVEEIRTICTATAAQLAETERIYGDLIPSFESEYTEAQAKDHDDIFGFAPVRRERVKEEW